MKYYELRAKWANFGHSLTVTKFNAVNQINLVVSNRIWRKKIIANVKTWNCQKKAKIWPNIKPYWIWIQCLCLFSIRWIRTFWRTFKSNEWKIIVIFDFAFSQFSRRWSFGLRNKVNVMCRFINMKLKLKYISTHNALRDSF